MKEQFSHFKALALKNLALQKKRKANTACQLFIPISIAIVVGIMQVVTSLSQGDLQYSYTSTPQSPFYYYSGRSQGIYYTNSTNTSSVPLGSAPLTNMGTGFLGNIERQSNYFNYTTTFYSPFFVNEDSPAEIDDLFYAIIVAQKANCSKYFGYNQYICYNNYRNTSAGILFNYLNYNNSNPNELDYVVQTGNPYYLSGVQDPDRFYNYQDLPDVGTYYTNMINSAFLTSIVGGVGFYNYPRTIAVGFSNMPYYDTYGNPNTFGNLMTLFMIPFALSFLFSVYMHTIVQEKKEGLVQKMNACGLSMKTYWVVNYIYNFLLYLLVATTLFIFGIAFGVQVFRLRTVELIILVLLWGTAQISMCHFLTCFISSPNVALMVGFMLSIFGTIGAGLLEAFLFLAHPYDMPAWGYLLYPGIAFYHGFGLLVLSLMNVTYPSVSLVPGSLFSYMLMILVAQTIIFYLLTWYVEAIFPREFGIRRHPLYPFYALKEALQKPKDELSSLESAPLLSDPTINSEPIVGDKDVVLEAQSVRTVPDAMVKIIQLKKIYKGSNGNEDKLAMNKVSFHIKKSECFGLLGPNGAGKTTLLSCLSGTISPTSGTAIIDNLDIRHDMIKVNKILGICPQFDVLWNELTVSEHLLFYFRLKNSSGLDVKEHIKEIIEQVGLEEVENRPASGLSGGQKRRLSIAIAMMGNPRLILLDEPTTGLDPSNRRALWDIIAKAKDKHSIMLSTHSMEEAEVLCSRIGIMRKAQLHSIGTPMHLKDKFSLGYNIKLSHFLNCEDKAHNFVLQTIPNAVLTQSFGDLRSYKVMRGDFVLSELFKKMELNKHRYGIKEWSISQANLEEVFLAIVTEDESEAK